MKRIIICLVLLIGLTWRTATAEIILIANTAVPETTLAQKEVRKIFMKKRAKWGDNVTIKPAVLEEKEIHSAFLKQYVKRSPSRWKTYWKKMVFTGRALPPRRFKTQDELVRYVAETPGAIAYVDAETAHDNVMVISVK